MPYNARKLYLLFCKAFMKSDRILPPKRLPVKPSCAVIAALGGSAAVARQCGIRTASVSEWKVVGIPRPRILFLRERYRDLPVMKTAEVRDF